MRCLLLIMVTLLLASCRTSRTGVNSEPAAMASKDSIVFISMKMWHDSLQESNHIEVLEVLTKPGSLKRQLVDNSQGENYLKCIVQNKKTGIRDSFFIEHPLYKDVEVMGENSQLSKHRLDLKESQFFVRFQKKDYNILVIKEKASFTSAREKEIKVVTF